MKLNEAQIDGNGGVSLNGWFRGIVATLFVSGTLLLINSVIANDKESRGRDDILQNQISTSKLEVAELRTDIARVEEKIDYIIKNVDDLNRVAPRSIPSRRGL